MFSTHTVKAVTPDWAQVVVEVVVEVVQWWRELVLVGGFGCVPRVCGGGGKGGVQVSYVSGNTS